MLAGRPPPQPFPKTNTGLFEHSIQTVAEIVLPVKSFRTPSVFVVVSIETSRMLELGVGMGSVAMSLAFVIVGTLQPPQ
jgi:hypothetical protein